MSWEMVGSWLEIDAVQVGLNVTVALVVAFVLTRLLRRAVRRVESKVSEDTTPLRALQRTQTLTKVLSSAGIVAIWTITGFYVLESFNVTLAPLLASVGIVGLAVGFGAQNLVRDVVAGFFILLEDQYGVGDIIMINQVASGKVEQLTMRVTGMRDLDGTLHYIANGEITHVANRTKDWARAIIDVGVAHKEDPARIREVLDRVAEEAKADEEFGAKMYSTPEILGVEMIGDYEVTWRMTVDTKPGKQFEVAREMRERIKVAFDDVGVEIPFPPQVLIRSGAPDGGQQSA